MVSEVSYINRKQSTLNKSEQSLLILLDREFSVWGNRMGTGSSRPELPLTAITVGSLYKDEPHNIGSLG